MVLVEKLTEILESSKQDEQKGKGSRIGAIVAAVVVMIVFAVLGLVAWSRGRKIAKLKHERDLAKEMQHQAELEQEFAENDAAAEQANQKAAEELAKVAELEAQIQKNQREHEETLDRISNIASWSDVDEYLDGS